MFNTAAGVSTSFPERIKEEFKILEHCIRFNVSFEKIRPMLDGFLDGLQEPLFIVLQFPLTQQEEAELRKDDTDPLHQKVCYLDRQSKDQVKAILQQYNISLLIFIATTQQRTLIS